MPSNPELRAELRQMDPNDVIAKIGDIWKSWGWYV